MEKLSFIIHMHLWSASLLLMIALLAKPESIEIVQVRLIF